MSLSAEHKRLEDENPNELEPWKKWGPYVSERMWGTVREDYSANGDAWNYLTHDQSRSVAYRWGEDGLAGISDLYQTLVFSLALWNGKDPILKERLFGLNPNEGNHGEDVKECYFYLDSTPSHSYMKWLYKYPQKAFPYQQLIEENQKRTTQDPEYEIFETGIFQDNRYFDVFVEYAKGDPEDICIRIEIVNRGLEAASIDLVPQLFFRNIWSWDGNPHPHTPSIKVGPSFNGGVSLVADSENLAIHYRNVDHALPKMYLYGSSPIELLFTNNETNNERVWKAKNRTPYVKDAFHRYIIQKENCLNPLQEGTKACFHYKDLKIEGGGSQILYFRLTTKQLDQPLEGLEEIFRQRKKEADDFYEQVQPSHLSTEDKLIQRQAFAGMLWSKQFYHFDVSKWLSGDNPALPPPESRYDIRNEHWRHLEALDVISMPDKWEYPWFASWDLAFHATTLAFVDLPFAKQQLHMVLQHQYQHPNGQIPAYEWTFSDLNPPAQAWALLQIHRHECKVKGEGI